MKFRHWLNKLKYALPFECSVQEASLGDTGDVANEDTQSAEDQLATVVAESCPSPMQYTHTKPNTMFVLKWSNKSFRSIPLGKRIHQPRDCRVGRA